MPTDTERWRVLADHKLTLYINGGDYGYRVHLVARLDLVKRRSFLCDLHRATPEEAIDLAIDPIHSEPRTLQVRVVGLEERGWVN
jgi:hypothetical protein